MIVHAHLPHCVGVTTVAAIFEVTRERKLTSVSSLTRAAVVPASGYCSDGVVQAVASSIHSGVVTTTGRVLTFGCGSDGRMGVRKYMEGLSGSRSRMKCYVSEPTEVEGLREAGWTVTAIDTSKSHMVALARRRS